MNIKEELFGHFKDPDTGTTSKVFSYILKNSKGVIIKLISLGASINSIQVPDSKNQLDHVVLGFDSVEGHLESPYMGSTIGRVANRVSKGRFSLCGEDYQLSVNHGPNHLHGGARGWEKFIWKSSVEGDKVVFTHISPDGDQGYPGDVMAQVIYSFDDEGGLRTDFSAMASRPTPINLSNHAYFNLAGHGTGRAGLLEHQAEVSADFYLGLTQDFIPTGEILPLARSPLDLRRLRPFSEALSQSSSFDHCFCIRGPRGTLRHAALFIHPPTGRRLEVLTTEAGVQLYTANFLPDDGEPPLKGIGDVLYSRQGAFCCESQNFPNAINQSNFPSCVLWPGQRYEHSFVYKFSSVG